jgi:dipeptidyl aminopeptidase/acylaminoacyl peptidase
VRIVTPGGRATPRAAQFLLFSISALALFAAGSGWLAIYPPVPRDLDGAPDLDAVARAVRIPVGSDSLDGWTLAGREPAVVIVFHGYGRDHTRAWRYAQFLNGAGYGVVTVNFRSSRARDRRPTTLGHHELADAEATLAWVRSRPETRGARIAVLGESLGASVGLVLAARHPEIAAVVADCPFATGRRAVEDSMERWAHLPRALAALACRVGRAWTGCDPCAFNVLAAAESLGARPLFLIHAARDDRFSPEQARDLWRAAGAKDELWLLDTGHNEGWQLHREEYERRVLAFFDRALEPEMHETGGASAGTP